MQHNNSSKQFKDRSRQVYISRINKVLDYINTNIDRPLDLEKLAEVATFSRFHFHRLFSSIMDETLNAYVKRKRVTRAAGLLLTNQNLTVAEIAEKCGFTAPDVFSRAFKEYFSCSPTVYREGGYQRISKNGQLDSKNGQAESKNGQAIESTSDYLRKRLLIKNRRLKMNVQIQEIPEFTVAYCRNTGPFQGIGQAFGKLMHWAGPRGFLSQPDRKVLAIYYDDPLLVEEGKLQSSACISIPEDTEVSGEIAKMKIAGGKYAMAHFEITEEKFGEAWNSVMREWLPQSGYQCADSLPFELYHNNHEEHPEKKFILDICVPVVPL